MNTVFEEIYKTVWKEVFPNIEALEINKFKELFTFDVDLPKKHLCEKTNKEVFISDRYKYPRLAHEDFLNEGQTPEVKEIGNLGELLKEVKPILLFRGNKTMNSEVVEESDHIYSSSYIYNSQHIYLGQKILFSENCSESEYLLASRGGSGCNFGIRVFDSSKTSNSFDIDWSGNTVNSYFIHDCYDLRDCMFCFHTRSKQFCIGNRQYTKEKYFELKEKILKEYFEQLNGKNPFVTLKDL
jgi:hypothetical protein